MKPEWAERELRRIARLERQADKARAKVEERYPSNYCHPVQAKRTKCVCGAVVRLGRFGHREARCTCGRLHVKQGGSAFRSARDSFGQQSRAGGRKGCPGIKETEALNFGVISE